MAYTLIRSEDRGDTLYVGSRASDQLGRLYDKERESKDSVYAGCWRWEVQYRRAYAMSTLRALMATESEAAPITATVGRWFSDRSVGAAFAVDATPLVDRPAGTVPDDQRWLEWVRRCVQPRAREMVRRYGWRFIAEACAGRIETFEAWESIMRSVEIELEDDDGPHLYARWLDHATSPD